VQPQPGLGHEGPYPNGYGACLENKDVSVRPRLASAASDKFSKLAKFMTICWSQNIYKMIILIITILFALLSIAFFTIAERKVLASIQRRRGPNVVGFWGLLQAFADGLKLLLKEVIIPQRSNWVMFLAAPCWALAIGLLSWIFIPWSEHDFIVNFDYSLLFLYAFSSLGVYGIIGAVWTSNSKYAFLGGLRSAAQLISYEVSIALLLLPVAACANSFNIVEIVEQQKNSTFYMFPLFPIFIIFFISMLAETNRAPFDLPEAEAEIVAGYNVEYASMTFAMFFLAEYSNMLWLSALSSLLFLGGWCSPLSVFSSHAMWAVLKTLVIAFLIIHVRANYPRFRYDQLMGLGWKVFLPFAIGYFLFVTGILIVA
jgi:NADH-quinone oxidoreductase subunit H